MGYCRFQIGDMASPVSLEKDAERSPNGNPHISRHATTVGLVNQEKRVGALSSQGDGLRLTGPEKCCEGRDHGGPAGMSLLDPGGVYQLFRPILPFAANGHLLIDVGRDEDAPKQILEQVEVPCARQVNERAGVADHPHFTRPSSASNSPSANAKGEIRCRAMKARSSAWLTSRSSAALV